MKKKYVYIITIIIAIYTFSFFLLLPYAQKAENSHFDIGTAFGTVYYVLSTMSLLWGIIELKKRKDIKLFLLFISLFVVLLYWGFKLKSLYCLACASGG